MSEKHEEVSNWREKVQKLEQQRLLELEELKKHLDLLKNSYVNNPNGLEFQAERLAYETNISQLKSRISALEASIREKHMKQDVQIREYETKNQELRAKIRSYENSKENEIIGFKEMNERLKGQFDVYIYIHILSDFILKIIKGNKGETIEERERRWENGIRGQTVANSSWSIEIRT